MNNIPKRGVYMNSKNAITVATIMPNILFKNANIIKGGFIGNAINIIIKMAMTI
jgi:hypothetical protein